MHMRLSRLNMMKVLWLLSCALLLRHMDTNAQGSMSSTCQDVHQKHCIDKGCDGVLKPNGFWDARCRLNGSLKTLAPVVLFETLDLSSNNLEAIPTEFLLNQSQLTNLTLAHNYISTIKDGAFGTLYNVTFIDLSFNRLRRWEGEVITQLPNLVTLIVTGSDWIPDSNVLGLPSLKRIVGVTWSHECTNCTLFKVDLSPFLISKLERGNSKFVEHGFYPFCSQRICSPSLLIFPNESERVKVTSVPKKLFYSSYVLGAIAVLLNLIILITVVSSRSLRKTTSMLLIANMALCDLLIGVYSLIIGNLNIFNFLSRHLNVTSGGEKLVLGGGILCPLATAIFTSAECVEAVTSLLLTVEKYFSIVHYTNPDRRLSKNMAAVCLLFFWVASFGYALAPLFHVPNLSYTATMMCSFPVTKKNTFLFCLGALIALYIVNIPLYVKIYLFVRRSFARVGVRRDARVLKKIILVVGSNFVLLLTPIILIIIFVPVENIHKTIGLNNDHNTQVLFVLGFWFPIACLGLNACINPILCAFRQDQFVKQMRKLRRMLKLFDAPLRARGPSPLFQQSSKVSPPVLLTNFTHYRTQIRN